MRKLLLGSASLILFSISIILFQISCKKVVEAQEANNCSETATVNFTINFPSNFSVSTSATNSNNIDIKNQNITPYPTFFKTYSQDFRNVGTAHQKNYVFKNVIPDNYEYRASAIGANGTSFIQTTAVPIKIVAGQIYNIIINSTDFH